MPRATSRSAPSAPTNGREAEVLRPRSGAGWSAASETAGRHRCSTWLRRTSGPSGSTRLSASKRVSEQRSSARGPRCNIGRVPDSTVLVVDDDPVILKLLEVNFEMEGFTVLVARDGREFIEVATRDQPDLVVSDIMMRKTSGIELVIALKGDPNTRHIPIILLSAKAQNADVRSGLEAGADDYVTKPFEPLDLVDRVNRLLEARASKRPS